MKDKLEQIFKDNHHGFGEYDKDAIIKELLNLFSVVLPTDKEGTFCDHCKHDYYTEIDGVWVFTCTCRRI